MHWLYGTFSLMSQNLIFIHRFTNICRVAKIDSDTIIIIIYRYSTIEMPDNFKYLLDMTSGYPFSNIFQYPVSDTSFITLDVIGDGVVICNIFIIYYTHSTLI